MAENEVTQHHVAFLQSRGYDVKDVKAAKKFVAKLNDKESEGFFAESAEWKEPTRQIQDHSLNRAVIESREGRDAKKFKVLRHLTHNEMHHKPGDVVGEEHFTPEQVKALLDTQTMEEVVEEEDEEEEKK